MMRNFDTGATRDSDDGKIHFKGFLSPHALRRFGEYMEVHRVQADGSLRAPDNWKRGIPLDAYEDSLIRHVHEAHALFDEGKRAEAVDVMCAILFNVQGWLHEMTKPVLPKAEEVSNDPHAGEGRTRKLLEVDTPDEYQAMVEKTTRRFL